jgi:hypothetical protein
MIVTVGTLALGGVLAALYDGAVVATYATRTTRRERRQRLVVDRAFASGSTVVLSDRNDGRDRPRWSAPSSKSATGSCPGGRDAGIHCCRSRLAKGAVQPSSGDTWVTR